MKGVIRSRADVRFRGDGLDERGEVRYKKFSRVFNSGGESQVRD